MKKFVALLLFFTAFIISQAQTQSNTSDGTSIYFNQSGIITNLPKQKTAPVGSVYLNDQWNEATIILMDSTKLTGLKAKYNLLTKKFELQQSNDENIYTVYFSQVSKVIFDNNGKKYVLINTLPYFVEYPELLNGYDFFIVHTKGKITFLEAIHLDKIYANYNTALDVGSTSDKYVKKSVFFVEKSGKLNEFYLTRYSVLKYTKDKKDQIKDFVKKHRLSYRKKNDIIKIFNYYNSL